MHSSVRRSHLIALAACALAAVANGPAASAASSPAARITVRVDGIDGHKGQLKIGLFNKAEGWPTDKAAVDGRNVPLDRLAGNHATVTFDGIKPGRYAVGAYHDVNMNDKLDKNFLGVPKEQWGVSNNPRPRLRAPRYEEAVFDLGAGGRTVAITLHR